MCASSPISSHTQKNNPKKTTTPTNRTNNKTHKNNTPNHTSHNKHNNNTIADLRADDVVEVSCRVDREGVHPLPAGKMPEAQSYLVQSVKHYERLTVAAIRERSRALAVEALVAHPLVLSYSRAEPLVDNYLKAHRPDAEEWA